MGKTTIRGVAQHAGVGVGTVSRVLNGSPSVSDATRQKVQAAIEHLQYAPNLTARNLSRGKTMNIGVIVPHFTNPSVVRRLQGVVSVVSRSDYDMILFDIESMEQRDTFLRDVPRRRLVDGLLIISLTPTDQDVAHFYDANLPTVLVDARHDQLCSIMVDNVAGGYQATKHLIASGHQKIGFISDFLDDQFNNTPVQDRLRGYKQALAEANILFRSEYHVQGKHGRLPARAMTHQLLDLPDPPTAIFAYSDTQAIGVIEAARERGLTIPDDLSIIGFDNIEAAEYLNITTIRQALYESGVRGTELLLENMDKRPFPPVKIVLPTNLIERSTTKEVIPDIRTI